MNDLFWPGSHRAGNAFSQEKFLAAMLAVEEEWLRVLVDQGVAPAEAAVTLELDQEQADWVVDDAEVGGNPASALVTLLREAPSTKPATARWLHRGLTSQDVVDSALVWMLRNSVRTVCDGLRAQADTLSALAQEHRATPMVARTLTQHAVPTTFGLMAAHWLTAVLDALDDLRTLAFPVQLGGAAGTMAAAVELGLDPTRVREALAGRLGLGVSPAWHTSRATVTRAGDALVRCTDAWGRIAGDVLVRSRPEIGELSEGVGGASSTMPHKANPVLSVLVRRAATTTPQLAATLHLAAAEQVDERADGAWHAEWATLRDLVERTVVAGSQTSELLADLSVHPDRMAATLEAAHDDVRAEQRSMAELAGHEPEPDYLGEVGGLVDAVVARAQEALR